MSAPARPALKRSALVAAAGQALLTGVMLFAAVDSSGADRSMFWALAACAGLGAVAALLLGSADRRTAKATDQVNRAVAVVGVGFCAGALAAFLGENPLVLAIPVALVLVNAMLVGAARRVQSEPL